MKKTKDCNVCPGTGETKPLLESTKLMEVSLIAWRESLKDDDPRNSGRLFDTFLVAAREGFRLMALKQGLGADDANDVAQTCVLQLVKRANSGGKLPFEPSKIDELRAGMASLLEAPVGFGSPLFAFLYKTLSNGVSTQAKKIRKIAKRAGTTDVASAITIRPANLIKKVSAAQNLAFWEPIQGEYLDSRKHKGTSLRIIFGDWTPTGEWSEQCTIGDRPSKVVIPLRTLERHIANIRKLILQAKSKTLDSADKGQDHRDPSLFQGYEQLLQAPRLSRHSGKP